MKNRNLFAGIILLGSVVAFQACNENLVGIGMEDNFLVEKSGKTTAIQGDSCTFSGVLTEVEIDGLKVMREEEKLAGDLYFTFFEQYGQVIFENISKSEAVHTSAILNLLTGYGLEDPALDSLGEFSNPLFNQLFTQLTEKGSVSLVEALKVGAFIEEYDINDLMLLLKETDNSDVARVYSNLLSGSESHLKAFTNVLALNDESYIPTIISETLYQEILDSSTSGNYNSNLYGSGNGLGSGNGTGTSAGQGNYGSCDGTGVETGQGNNGSVSGNGNGTAAGQGNNGSCDGTGVGTGQGNNGSVSGNGNGTAAGQGNNGSCNGTGVGTGQGNNGSVSGNGNGTTAGQESNGSANKGNGKK
jgi:hypothetical protein